MIPFVVFKLICYIAAGIGIGAFVAYLYIKNRLEKWVKEIQEEDIYG